MKKYLTTGIILFMVSLILFIDALKFRYCIVNGVGDGSGLYLFFGIWEINDTIPYSIAPNYLYPLYLIAGLFSALAIYFIYKVIKFRKLGF
ncbi:MAG: hypothetical protein GX633_09570 [Clostridiales bacterium]|nr:hypothetical protein [Clostridiales bacterium]